MTSAVGPAPRNRQRRPVTLLRPVPGPSPIHDLWAGTKLIAVFAISVLLTFYPDWVPLALLSVLILVTARVARVPFGALPSVPWWFWVLMAIGGITATLGGGDPVVHLGGWHVGLGGLLSFTRVTIVALVLLGVCMLVSWTTNTADIAPALATLGRPLKIFRLPVDDWAVATALALRSFPMLLDEFRLLLAARRLRPKPHVATGRARRWSHELIDMMTAGITVALRRGDEMGDAITARGGTGQIAAAPSGPKARDWVALSIVAAVCALALALQLTVFAR
ncbi:MAG: energy-coupling factor transporter transmembrane protein EcfT [Mycobacterium sp.]